MGLGDCLFSSVGVDDGEASLALKIVEVHVRADVLVLAVLRNHVVPAVPLANLERSVDETASTLAKKNVLGDLFHVPSLRSLEFKGLEDFLGLSIGAGCKIGKFLGVFAEVVKLRWVCRASDVLPLATSDHAKRSNGALAHVFGKDGVVTLLALEVRHHGDTVHGKARDKLGADQIAKSCRKIQGRDVLRDTVRSKALGVGDEHGNTDGALEIGHLVPQTTLTQHVTVVTAEDDNGVVGKLALLKNVKKLSNAVIDVRDGTVVSALGSLDLVRGEVVVLEIADVAETSAVRVLVFGLDVDFGEVDIHTLVHVPVLVLDGVRVVGVGQRDGQSERPLLGTFSDVVVEELLGLVDNLLVVVELVASDAGAGLQDGAAVVVPLQPSFGLIPVDRPAKVARVDVGSQSLLVTVQLVADEMHLACKSSLVAGRSEVVCVCGLLGAD